MADRHGFDAWARAAIPALFGRAKLLTSDHHAAQDLVQDTLTKLYVVWPRLDEGGNIDAYAKQTLFHVFVSKRRLRSAGEVVTDDLPERIAHHVDPSVRMDLDSAIAKLKPAERAVIVARYVDDVPVADVARLVGKSEAWVRTTAMRTLGKLRNDPQLSTTGA